MRRDPIELYVDAFWISPYAMYAFVTLKEKGLPVAIKELGLHKGEQKTEAFRKVSLTGKLPAIVDQGFALSESMAIVEYLDERYPAPAHTAVLPQDVQRRGTARQVLAWLNSDFGALREERSTHSIWYQPSDKPLSAKAQADADKLIAAADRLLPEGQSCLFGAWSIADTALALMLNRLKASGAQLPMKLARYVDTQWARPSVQEWSNRDRIPYTGY